MVNRSSNSSDSADSLSQAQTERLLLGANRAAALGHKLALIDIEGRHRISQHRSHFNPDQPRVPAGDPDGGQWTATGHTTTGIRLAAEKPRFDPGAVITFALEFAKRMIEAYRSENGPWDLFGHKGGAVTVTTIDGVDIFGSNSASPTYTSEDRAAAMRLRNRLIQKHPEVFRSTDVGQMPRNALFHAETTVLLRAARHNSGTLAGRTLTVFADTAMCNNCKEMLPYVGLALGNPTVAFVDPDGSTRTMRDGAWIGTER